ncbi:MAG: MBL fold metallo-hydrolase, partial [Anaerolineales bacterium]|nr:MBL fold metallo-hydrolase [Anaerolineales bacterium]
FQGGRSEKALNWDPFPITPERIDAVLLTHAHIDHVGYLPRLVHQGFRGPVYATEASQSLLEIVLPDSAHLQEQDAYFANKKGYSRHKPALPLYTAADAEATLRLIQSVAFDRQLALDGFSVTWQPAGHILGSSILETEISKNGSSRRVVFSGDLGRYHSEVMRPPASVPEADVLLVESTYGDRLHSEESIQDILTEAIQWIVDHEGVLLIPAFAVGRTQEILYHIRQLQEKRLVPDLPVFIDSPMAVEARECPLRCHDTRFVQDVEESKELNIRPGPAIVIAASGMCNGGRIMHHLKWRLPDKRNAVLFVGYQARDTRGRMLLDGVKRIRIHGEEIPVRARIMQVHALSAHADRDELLRWLGGFTRSPRRTFIVHGEPESSQVLREHIRQRFGWEASVPSLGEAYEIV